MLLNQNDKLYSRTTGNADAEAVLRSTPYSKFRSKYKGGSLRATLSDLAFLVSLDEDRTLGATLDRLLDFTQFTLDQLPREKEDTKEDIKRLFNLDTEVTNAFYRGETYLSSQYRNELQEVIQQLAPKLDQSSSEPARERYLQNRHASFELNLDRIRQFAFVSYRFLKDKVDSIIYVAHGGAETAFLTRGLLGKGLEFTPLIYSIYKTPHFRNQKGDKTPNTPIVYMESEALKKRILVVDDDIDTGRTIFSVLGFLTEKFNPDELYFGAPLSQQFSSCDNGGISANGPKYNVEVITEDPIMRKHYKEFPPGYMPISIRGFGLYKFLKRTD
jgi:hypoxanthine phosphoribosyltransferase